MGDHLLFSGDELKLRGLRPLFFLFEDIAASWPYDFAAGDLKGKSSLTASSDLKDLAVAIRSDADPLDIQSALLLKIARKDEEQEECEILLCWLAFNRLDQRAFGSVLAALREKNPSRLEVRVLTLLAWLHRNDLHSVAMAPSELWAGLEHSYLLQLCKADFYLKAGELSKSEEILNGLPDFLCPEMVMLRASLVSRKESEHAAIELLLSQLHRCPRHIGYYRQLLNHMIEGKDAVNVMPCALEALSKFGEHPEILYHFTALNLYKRQPGLAKRSALLQQISASIRPTSISLCNQLATYEMNGQADWMRFLNPVISSGNIATEPHLQANLVMQLASIQSERYPAHLQSLVDSLQAQPGFLGLRKSKKDLFREKCDKSSPLRIAWMTGDCNYHPVARFLYGWFSSQSNRLSHQHVMVNLVEHRKESYCNLFRSIPGMEVHDVSGLAGNNRLQEIRGNRYDVVIDLSGWTGGNFIAGLNPRLAPVQVNYLGYFASSGLASMDYWLGDSHLFPSGHTEWSTETLFRLQRPFLAWTPQKPLPEADISVSTAPSGPIRFGSFNHNRKLSDATLRLWAEVLDAVSGSRLVLKASSQTDFDTQRLLRRRMLRQGLDPERVDWLSLTKGPTEHMQQYAYIDIALDPIPNGGCTTTCEALWMGVPTITLAGSHYVSRMSTSVLAGANMPDWIAQDRPGYINLAREHATRVAEFRANRGYWRGQLQSSPLGDAADLMHHLEAAFSEMHVQALSRA